VLAIGECGLDRSIKIPFEKQFEVFKFQIQLSKKLHKPLIIHCVKAYSDLIHILKEENFKEKFVLHNFNGNQFQIESFLKFEAYFSLGKQMMDLNSKLHLAINNIPIERLFFETDISEFSIEEMYIRATNLLNISKEKLNIQIINNFKNFIPNELIE